MATAFSIEQSGRAPVTMPLQLTVGTTAVQIPFFSCNRILVKSDPTNTANVYIGLGSGTTIATGFPISPNGAVGFGTTMSDKYWLISTAAGQVVEILVSTMMESIQYSSGNSLGGSADTNVNLAEVGGVNVTFQQFGNQIAALTAFQAAVTNTAAALASHACNVAVIKNDDASTVPIYIGGTGVTTSTGFKLSPGQGIGVNIANTNEIFVVASTTGGTAEVLYG